MRHECATRHGENGPYHYVSLGRDGGYPIGYCTTACDHQTAEEAHEHYRQYVLDHLREMAIGADTQHRCAVPDCDNWTQKGLQEPDGYGHALLCDEHRNRATFEQHFYPADGPVREAWVS
ncbi:MAG TPA: hypothetical protein VFN75_10615 [Pseudonocardiaceae bacterium]|nr:hypothetical protein [Pseudonocardiaceae bacterium]